MRRVWLGCLVLWSGVGWAENRYAELPVVRLSAPVVVDGDFADWDALGVTKGQRLALSDSEWEAGTVSAPDEDDPPARELLVRAAYHEKHFYLALEWPDATMNAVYKPWKLAGEGYRRSREVDDMLVVRWQLGDSFNACMLSSTRYRTDVWRWSAGRSNLSGVADDMRHEFADKPFDKPAREYEGNKGTIYFVNEPDAGFPGWQSLPTPKPGAGPVVPSVAKAGDPSGSRADVAAKGHWKDGVWRVEMSRRLRTDDSEDVVLEPGVEQVAQFAVFYAGYRMRKFITAPVRVRLPNG
ncbi:MAG: hypothetical protein HQL96_13220 [Magnetococcales bacterium]|nr:hypothetical protein [Magnetococcales bacterium]